VRSINTMDMKTTKTTLLDFVCLIKDLNKKYLIDDFCLEVEIVFKDLNLTHKELNNIVYHPMDAFSDSDAEFKIEISDESIQKYVEDYNGLKKKYNYDEYIKEGHKLRRKFLKERKEYLFNSIKVVDDLPIKARSTIIEKLSLDYSEQYFVAKWIDQILKKIDGNNGSMVLTYEDVDSKIKTVEVAHQVPHLDSEFIEAPLIDRMIGSTIFDSFLLHSFFNITEKKWQYIPVKLIISMEHKINMN